MYHQLKHKTFCFPTDCISELPKILTKNKDYFPQQHNHLVIVMKTQHFL
jgi:hypothetical protein